MKLLNIILAALIAFTMLALMGCPPQETPAPDDVDEPAVETPAVDPAADPVVDPTTSMPPADSVDGAVVTDDAGNSVVMESPDGETIIHVSPDGGSTIVTSDGTVVTSEMNALPEEWPEDFPIMEGFAIFETEILPDNEGIIVSTEGTLAVSEALAFYNDITGWEVVQMNDFTADGEELALLMMAQNEKSMAVQITVDPEKDLTVINMRFNQPPVVE